MVEGSYYGNKLFLIRLYYPPYHQVSGNLCLKMATPAPFFLGHPVHTVLSGCSESSCGDSIANSFKVNTATLGEILHSGSLRSCGKGVNMHSDGIGIFTEFC